MIIRAFKIQDELTFFSQERLWSLRGAISECKCGQRETCMRCGAVCLAENVPRLVSSDILIFTIEAELIRCDLPIPFRGRWIIALTI